MPAAGRESGLGILAGSESASGVMSNGAEITVLLAHTEWTRSLARSLAGDAHQAEDLLQEAWVAAL